MHITPGDIAPVVQAHYANSVMGKAFRKPS